jgi:hypothetical protein
MKSGCIFAFCAALRAPAAGGGTRIIFRGQVSAGRAQMPLSQSIFSMPIMF